MADETKTVDSSPEGRFIEVNGRTYEYQNWNNSFVDANGNAYTLTQATACTVDNPLGVQMTPSRQDTLKAPTDYGVVQAFAGGVVDNATFGHAAEAGAATNVLFGGGYSYIENDNSIAARYQRVLPHFKEKAGNSQFLHPYAWGGGQVATTLAAVAQAAPKAIVERFIKSNAKKQVGKTTVREAVDAGEPVSVANGEYLETWRDFFVPGATLALDGSRYMGLKLPMPTRWRNPLGACQISAFDEFFANPDRGVLEFHQADGKIVSFERPFNFLPSVNAAYPHLELKAPWLGQLTLKDRRIVKHFAQYDDRFYRLEKIEDLNGNALSFTRSETGVLEKIESSDGLALVFSNDGEGRRLSIALIGTDGSELELARYAYDARGRMISADCAFGMSVRYYWSTTKPLLKRWHNLTRRSETVFQYDAEGRVVHTATSGIWNDDRFRYNSEARETTYLPAGEETRAQRFHYDEHENVTAEIDALGRTVRHRYDEVGQRIATADANGNESRARYDIRGNVRELTDAEGRSTVYGWGPHGDVDIIIDGAGGVRKFENDRFGNVVVARDAEKHETRFERDERGRLTKTIFADGTEETRAYDEYGRLAQIRDAKGGLTRFGYDAFGRMVERVDALGGVTRLDYEAGAGGFATPTRLTRPDGVSIGRRFDAEGSLASVSDGEGRQWHYRFGAFEVLEAITDPKGGELSFGYDSEGRLIAVTNAMGRVYALNRDVAGRVIEEEDFDGRVTRYRRDAGGRVIEAIKPDGGRLVYGYDRTDRVIRIETFAPKAKPEDVPQDVTRFWYDGRGLVIKAENGASLVEYERDKNGAIVAETVNGRRVEVKLDAMGRRTERRLTTPRADNPGESLITYSRDPLGLIESLTIDGHAPLSFQHDALGRETRRSSPAGFQLTSRHDAVGQLIEQIGGRDPGERIWQAAFGKASSRSSGTGIERSYRWDRANSPLAILDGLWGETTYEYDANGQVAATKAGEGTSDELRECFQYDAARNLVSTAAAGAGKLHGFGEALGKLTAWSNTPGGVVQIARGPRGERLALTHDECGRVIERKVERKGFRPKIWRYDWDGHDRLVKCVTPEGDIWRYGYDPFGRRVWKVRELTLAEARSHASRFPSLIAVRRVTPDYASGLLPPPSERRNGLPGQDGDDGDEPPVIGTAYSWDGDVIAEEAPLRLDGSTDWHRATRWHYEPGSFRPLAKQEAPQRKLRPDGKWEDQRGQLLYIVADHLGTPKEMVDERGKVQWAASYTTWGVIRGLKLAVPEAANDDLAENFGPDGGGERGGFAYRATRGSLALKSIAWDKPQAQLCPIRFQGQWEDEETGLYYNRHRHYDPLAGQYASPDPIGLEGGDRPQGYVAAPTVWIDPFGKQARDALGKWTGPGTKPGGLAEQAAATAYRNAGFKYYEQIYARAPNGEISILDGVAVKDAKWIVVESKPLGRSLTPGQRAIQKAIQDGKQIQLYGKNASEIPGLPKDGMIKFDQYEPNRY
ncbi:RHS repeat protein [Labrys sp. LIt4]|uniref:RHS repeat-associated core domain-containing protein n=1 Tax=Labrys sp. LIt4 TaxID=2821355 RepID=UPI001ADFAE08|nr:RHS repeat-associated core domain-containing protein [Labrys sp. LIt4]MBP0583434.1 RHS repeat protein [Labrys sp. LIt4]